MTGGSRTGGVNERGLLYFIEKVAYLKVAAPNRAQRAQPKTLGFQAVGTRLAAGTGGGSPRQASRRERAGRQLPRLRPRPAAPNRAQPPAPNPRAQPNGSNFFYKIQYPNCQLGRGRLPICVFPVAG